MFKSLKFKVQEFKSSTFNFKLQTLNFSYTVSIRFCWIVSVSSRSILPSESRIAASGSFAAIFSASLRASAALSAFSGGVSVVSSLVKIHLEGSKMTVSSSDLDFSMSAEENILCEYAGMPLNIGFRGPFLLELLNNIQSEDVIIRLADGTRAGVIVPAEQKEGEEVLMLLMPLMIND